MPKQKKTKQEKVMIKLVVPTKRQKPQLVKRDGFLAYWSD